MSENVAGYNAGGTWAIAELMGHLTLAGKVTMPGEHGGLWQIDIPGRDGSFHTEFFGSQSVYRIRIVSEEIARAYARKNQVYEYNPPIILKTEHDAEMARMREMNADLRIQVEALQRALPPGTIVDDSLAFEHDDSEPQYVPVEYEEVEDPDDPDQPYGNTF